MNINNQKGNLHSIEKWESSHPEPSQHPRQNSTSDTIGLAPNNSDDTRGPNDPNIASSALSLKERSISTPVNETDKWTGPIRYSIEYIDRYGEVCNSKSDSQPIEIGDTVCPGVLEVITTKSVSLRRKTGDNKVSRHPVTARTRIRIVSTKLLNVLRSIVDYYPGLDLSDDTIEFYEPFQFLVHHLDKLRQYKDNHPTCHDDDYRIETNSHIDYLLQVIDSLVGKRIKEEQERHSKRVATFQNLWMLFKPGEKVFVKHEKPMRFFSAMLDNINGGVKDGREKKYTFSLWNISYDGLCFYRFYFPYSIKPFDGEKEIMSLGVYPQKFHQDTDSGLTARNGMKLVDQMQVWGKIYWSLAKPCLKEYYGETIMPRHLPKVSLLLKCF